MELINLIIKRFQITLTLLTFILCLNLSAQEIKKNNCDNIYDDGDFNFYQTSKNFLEIKDFFNFKKEADKYLNLGIKSKNFTKKEFKTCISKVYYAIGKIYEVEELNTKEALKNYQKSFDTDGNIKAKLEILDINYFNQGKFYEGINELDKILSNKNIENEYDEYSLSLIYRSISGYYNRLGYYENSINYLNKTFAILERIEDYEDMSEMASLIALNYWYKTDYVLAEQWIEKAFQLWNENFESEAPADFYNTIGLIYGDTNRYEKAIESLKFYKNWAEKNNKFHHLYWANVNLALTYNERLKQYEEAEKYLTQAKLNADIAFKNNPVMLAHAEANVALNKIDLNQLDEAYKLIKKSTDVLKKYNNNEYLRHNYNYLGKLEKKRGNYKGSIQEYLNEIKILEKDYEPLDEHLANAYYNISQNYFLLNDNESAKKYINKSIDIINQRDLRNKSYGLRPKYKELSNNRDILVFYLKLVQLEYQNNPTKNNFNESIKIAQQIKNTVAGSTINDVAFRNDSEDENIRNLIKLKQNLANKILSEEENLLIANRSEFLKGNKKLIIEKANLITKLKEDLKIINNNINNQFIKNKKIEVKEIIELNEIQKNLSKNQVLIIYIVGDQELFSWAISNDSEIFLKRNINTADLKNSILKILKSSSYDKIFDVKESHEVYLNLIKPINKIIENKKDIILVGDSVFEKLPFSLLVQNKLPIIDYSNQYKVYKNANWLIKNFNISYLPSVSSIVNLKFKFDNQNENLINFLAFADPIINVEKIKSIKNIDQRIFSLSELPNTSLEVKQISDTLLSNNKLFLREMATEKNIKNLDLKNFNIIMFATHALPGNSTIGTKASIILSTPENPNEKDNGFLTSEKVMDLDLNSDWVILSACETTSGDDNSNETFSGLIRAFFFSGTKSIMATQWPIEDKSAVLFTTTMIKEYKRSNDKAFALNESSRNLINNSINEKFSHPSFWAPFILIGS